MIRPTQGFQTMRTVSATIKGFEVMRMIRRTNLWCKISGLATEADHQAWNVGELKRYIEVAIEAFGFERILFGGIGRSPFRPLASAAGSRSLRR